MASLTNVKIKELPIITASEVSDSDLLIVEKTDDTYAIVVQELKNLFSVDLKIASIKNELEKAINDASKSLETLIIALSGRVQATESNIQTLSSDATQIKKNITTIQNEINAIKELLNGDAGDISQIQKDLVLHANRIVAAEGAIKALQDWKTSFVTHVNDIETDLSNVNESIINIIDEFGDFETDTNSTLAELIKVDQDNLNTALTKAREYYEDCMKYFDYYFHVHADPPNWDEPWYWEMKIAGYAHPLHSLYHTTELNWDPTFYKIPGVWKLVGATTISEEENIIEYVYERLE